MVEEDFRFNLQLLERVDALCVLPDVLYCYHQQAVGSVTTRYNPLKFDSKIEAYRDEMRFAEQFKRPNIRNFFQDSLVSYVSSCVNNLCYASCPLNSSEKLSEIRRFFQTDEVQKAVVDFRPLAKRTWVMRQLIRHGLYRTCWQIHRIGQLFR